ncbi:hypothetical protein DSO57_1036136 [Entomophthora muscae]|uniref:Uncharacterized protein n=1 Tax=Entomophthora muscae TaxID=34485 RepID=A0ACC2SZF9_9FUNG|nr:hypothetical protein DSO57_1036136 [Entomophthora muscae]
MSVETPTNPIPIEPSSGTLETAAEIQAKQVPLTCSGHTRPVVQLQFSKIIEEKYYLISACKDGNPILRDGKTGDWIGTFFGHKGAVWSAKLNEDASMAVTGSADFTAKVWNACSGETLHSFTHKHIVRTADFNKEGNKIITGGYEKKIRLYDLSSPDSPPTEFGELPSNIKNLIWNSETNLIYSSCEDKTLRIWDTRTSTVVKSLDLNFNVTSMDMSFDKSFLMCTAGKEVKFWDSEKFDLIKSFEFSFDASSVSILPESHSRFVVGGVSDLWVRSYDFTSGEELEVYKGHHGPVHSVSYSPDGEIYATGSEDGTIRLWQTYPGKPYGLWQTRKVEDTSASTLAE